MNVPSVHAAQTSDNIAAYAASKGGLLALTRAVAIEFTKDNIRVNAILHGAVDTPMLRASLNRGHVQGGDAYARLDNLARWMDKWAQVFSWVQRCEQSLLKDFGLRHSLTVADGVVLACSNIIVS